MATTSADPAWSGLSEGVRTGTLTSLTSGIVEWLRSAERRRSMTAEQRVAQTHAAEVHGPALPAVAWVVYAVGVLVGGLMVMAAPTVAVVVVLSIVLRERGSPESKPVAAPHGETA